MKGRLTMEHKKMAVDCFNGTWDLIDKKDRSETDTLKMIHMAHASRHHWGEIGTPLEWSRGEWQISRVYTLANMGESALYHGKHALKYCLENNIGDFDLAFAYESIARAYAVLENDDEKQMYKLKAQEASNGIEKKENLEYFLAELATIS
ncbi:MAG TPA: hypothetical protein DCS67_11910 [Clostridiales bacterium UBA8960]|nr:hypothetical protein [Clostridiales bacterium UBA8960]